MDGVVQIEFLDERREIGGIGVDVIADPRLARASVAASIVRNAAVPRSARNTIWSSHASLFNGEPWLKTIGWPAPQSLKKISVPSVTVMV